MKTQILIFSILFSFIACSSNEESLEEQTLLGNWKKTARFDGGSPSPLMDVENGNVISFSELGAYSDSLFPDCEGTYELMDDTFVVENLCDRERSEYSYSFENGKLIIAFIPSSCIEECYDVYTKQ